MWWERIIELLLGKALERLKEKNTPRRQMTKAFVGLFVGMKDCHREYIKHRVQARNFWKENADKLFDKTGKLSLSELPEFWGLDNQPWRRTIGHLAVRIDKLRILLEIHDPALLDALNNYTIVEGFACDLTGMKLEGRGYATRQIAEAIVEKGVVSWDGDEKDDSIEFDSVMEKLREFMRDELKLAPEELLDI